MTSLTHSDYLDSYRSDGGWLYRSQLRPMFGTEEGSICWRNGCQGFIEFEKPDNCSCHINPPCSACTSVRLECRTCHWVDDEQVEPWNDHLVAYAKDGVKGMFGTASIVKSELRPLDPRKLDWHSFGHTNSSMIKRGVYPKDMTQAQVLEKVEGTFGGRFNYFGGGRFEYVAYTD